jgi:hypothetical protein
MNSDQWTGLLRTLVPPIVAYGVGHGYIPGAAAADIVAAVIAIGAAAWSWQTNSMTTMIKTVATMPEVKTIVTTGTVANSKPLEAVPNVVSVLPPLTK